MASRDIDSFRPTTVEELLMTNSETFHDPLWEEKLTRVSEHLKERLSPIPFYARKAAREGDAYWRRLAGSCPNLLGSTPN